MFESDTYKLVFNSSQLTFTCSKSIIVTPEKGVGDLQS